MREICADTLALIGGGSGIGLMAAQALAANGAKVFVEKRSVSSNKC